MDTQTSSQSLYSSLKAKVFVYEQDAHASEALGTTKTQLKQIHPEKEVHYQEAHTSFWSWILFLSENLNHVTKILCFLENLVPCAGVSSILRHHMEILLWLMCPYCLQFLQKELFCCKALL